MSSGVKVHSQQSALSRWIAAAVDRVLEEPRVDEAQISPDGGWVAFALSAQWRDAGERVNTAICVVPTHQMSSPQPLAGGDRSCSLPRWRPWKRSSGSGPSDVIAYVRTISSDSLVCVENLSGSHNQKLARFQGRVEDLQWSPDGRSLALLLAEDFTAQSDEADSDVIRGDTDEPWTRLWIVDVASGAYRPLSPEGVQVWEFAWSPDSNHFAVVVADMPGEGSWYRTRLATLNLRGEVSSPLYATSRQIVRPVWSPDGSRIAFLSCLLSDRDVGSGDVWLVEWPSGSLRDLTEGYSGTPTWIDWFDLHTLAVLSYEGCDSTVSRLTVDGRLHRLWGGAVSLGHHRWPRFSLAGGSWPMAVAREGPGESQEVWVAEPTRSDGLEWRRLTSLHGAWQAWQLGDAELIHWRVHDGLEIQGIVFHPPGAPPNPSPLVTVVHGGPTNLWSWRSYLLWHRLLTMLGCTVFLPNPRGSTGRGVAFAEANLRDYGGEDWQDIWTGIETLVARGTADPTRLGIGGWSYGGFMAAWAITQTTRFAAAMVGAGVSNWISFHGTTPLHLWDAANLGDPYTDPLPTQRSPIRCIDRAQTPTLIVHGLADRVVPPAQAQELYRGLRDRGVTADLFLYPREPHFFGERRHLHHLYTHIIGWFARHLGLELAPSISGDRDGGGGHATG